ncbi:BamA/TamA family outer membrane protein [Arenibacter sp. 6A1]|nr:BamA/TamA family outer membrane protein [Arenibacter sp. 6A1]
MKAKKKHKSKKKVDKRNKIIGVGILFLGLVLHSCSVKKYIPEGAQLYAGGTLELTSEAPVKDLKVVAGELDALLRPVPNSKILGIYAGLYAHFKAQQEKPGFINKFLNKKIGEKPVYVSDVNVEKTKALIQNRLENRGFFYNDISSKEISNKNSASIVYQVAVSQPYTMETYQLDTDSLPIYKAIQKSLGASVLKKGNRYDLASFKQERERIDTDLKSQGYYNFNGDFLIFEADTNRYKDRRFDLFLRLKKEVPQKSQIPYVIEDITVYPNYGIDEKGQALDSVRLNGIDFLQQPLFFKPKRLSPYILLEKGARYTPIASKLSSNRLSSIGTYKFVNIRYNELVADSLISADSIGALDARIYLSPLNKRSIRTELQAVSKSNNFAGPSLAVTYSNRNLFQGGETLNLSADGGYETQVGGKANAGLSSTKIGLKSSIVFPRLLAPIRTEGRFKYGVPKTKIEVGAEFFKRSQLYNVHSYNTSFGYLYNANKYVFHELVPLGFNYVKLSKSSAEFDAILNENPYLKSSFRQQFIAGLSYSFTYNELLSQKRKHPVFFNFNLDIAGNTLSLLSKKKSDTGKNTFLGLEYAQYAKVDVDFRHYWKLGNSQTLVSRVFGGIGLPYGNSTALPFSKQYYSGGPYSVRAFRIRSLGPGSYLPSTDNQTNYFDQAGDIRLEANIEYRFPIYSFFKGALFADAGNVWLIKENESLPGGKFTSDFINELGVGLGAGLRVDIQSFVIRLDLAAPLNKPYLPKKERWEIGIKEPILNFAIGYPF